MVEHDAALIQRVCKVFKNSKFDFVTHNVTFRFSEDEEDDFEMDVIAIHENIMIMMDCKSGNLNGTRTRFNSIKSAISNIKNNQVHTIRTRGTPALSRTKLAEVDEIYFGFVAGNDDVYKNQKENFKRNKIQLWNDAALKYFEKVSEVLGNLTINELFYKEFFIEENDAGEDPVDAVQFKQGKNKIYLFSLEPERLLKIGYVSRRGTMRNEGYQRIVNTNRLFSLSKFINKTTNLLMANPVILVFDPGVRIAYQSGKLRIPDKHCSAWIIDGQHRILAFKDVNLKQKKFRSTKFKIPVVAFDKLSSADQSETFVNINYYQKKIDSLLIYDLAASFKYPKNELVWPSMLAVKLNQVGSLKGLLKISEFDKDKPLKITTFVHPILYELLGFNENTDNFDGPLYQIKKFDHYGKTNNAKNLEAFKIHSDILIKYFQAIVKKLEESGTDWKIKAKDRGFFTASTVNALLLVLASILWKEMKKNIDFENLLEPLSRINFTTGKYGELSRGYGAVNGITKLLLAEINSRADTNYEYIQMSKRRKKPKPTIDEAA